MNEHQERVNNLCRLIYEFYETDDLFKLAEAQEIINVVFKENGFPIGKYRKWLKTKK